MIRTERLSLELLTLRRARLALTDRAALARELDALVPPSWPNEEFRPVIPLLIQEWEVTGGTDGWTWILLTEPDRVAIGTLGTKGGPDPTGMVEIGYGLVPEARGQGLMTEAVRAMIAELWACGVKRITAETEPTNVASHRVLERCGFGRDTSVEGVWTWALHPPV